MEKKEKSAMDRLYDQIEDHGFDSLTPSERWFFAITWFIMETNGNAMHGYFFNHSGGYCHDALRGLELVGAVRTASILRRAMAIFPNGDVPTDQGERRRVLCDMPDEVQWGFMGKLTDELFEEGEGVAGLVEKYVAAHRDEFPAFCDRRE
jgi:hypothetical protein